jgi:hypothetical protein
MDLAERLKIEPRATINHGQNIGKATVAAVIPTRGASSNAALPHQPAANEWMIDNHTPCDVRFERT